MLDHSDYTTTKWAGLRMRDGRRPRRRHTQLSCERVSEDVKLSLPKLPHTKRACRGRGRAVAGALRPSQFNRRRRRPSARAPTSRHYRAWLRWWPLDGGDLAQTWGATNSILLLC